MDFQDISIKGSTTSSEIYSHFIKYYHRGYDPREMTINIVFIKFEPYFKDEFTRNNSFFGLALAQWETNCLDKGLLNIVEKIILSNSDITLWAVLGANDVILQKRKDVLDKFLQKLKTQNFTPLKKKNPNYLHRKMIFEEIKSYFLSFFQNSSSHTEKYESKYIVKIISPDEKKEFCILKFYINGIYDHTSGILSWKGSGCGVLHFIGEKKYISAKWIDSKILEIEHFPSIWFKQKRTSAYFMGDEVNINYKEKLIMLK